MLNRRDFLKRLAITGIALTYSDFALAAIRKESIEDQLFPVTVDGKRGFINSKGSVVIKPQFDSGWVFLEGLALIRMNDKFGYIDKKGAIMIETKFKDAFPFYEGLAAVVFSGDKKWGYIDRLGHIVIKPQFDETDCFSEGLASVVVERSWGYIDKAGEIVIKPQFEGAFCFSEGLANVWIDSRCGYIVKAASDCPYFREIKCPLFIDRKSLNVYSSFSSAFS